MAEQQKQQKQAQEPDVNQLLKVRREKLKELQESGSDPFQITKYDVTCHSQDIRISLIPWRDRRYPSRGV